MNDAQKKKAARSGRPLKRATMTDVATQAGVSQSTVSLVLNAMTGAKLSEETRQKVLRIASEMGYRLPEGRKAATGAVSAVALPASADAAQARDSRQLIL